MIAGIELAKEYNVKTVAVRQCDVRLAVNMCDDTDVLVGTIVGFPHGDTTTLVKVAETKDAIANGSVEIGMVLNIGKLRSRNYDYVRDDIRTVVEAVGDKAIVKVIFENDFLPEDKYKIKLCEICNKHKVDFVKTSTGYGFVKGSDGKYSYEGATEHDLKLMREHSDPEIQVKAAGGVRTYEDTLKVRELGVSRIGATATISIVEAAKGNSGNQKQSPEGY